MKNVYNRVGTNNKISEALDVSVSGVQNGQILVWDAAVNKWKNANSTSNTLGSLSDVNLVDESDKQVLKYDLNTNTWINERVKLSELLETNVSNPLADSVLKYSGTAWENKILNDQTYTTTLVSGTITAALNTFYITNVATINMPGAANGACIKINNLGSSALTINFTTVCVHNNIGSVNRTFSTSETCYLEFNQYLPNTNAWVISKCSGRLLDVNTGKYINYSTPAIEDLRNLVILGPLNNQLLRYDGVSWVNSAESVSSVFGRTGAVAATSGDYSLSQIGGVSLSAPQNNQLLRYDGVSWVNSAETSYLRAFSDSVLIQNQTVTMTNGTIYRGINATVNVLTGASTYLGATMSLFNYSGTVTLSFPNNASFAHQGFFWGGGGYNFSSVDDGAQITLSCILISGAVAFYSFDSIVGEWTFSEPGYKKLTSAWTGIENLKNVSITTPASGEILSYNGTDWTNISPSRCLPTAEIYLNGDGTTDNLTLTAVSDWYIFNSATTFNANPSGSAVFNSPSNGAIKYTGPSGKYFHTAVSLSMATNTSANSYEVALFRNGVLENGTVFGIDFANNGVVTSTAFHKVISTNLDDIFELKMRNISAGGAVITYNNINVVFMACCN